jgi:hypothetical protein
MDNVSREEVQMTQRRQAPPERPPSKQEREVRRKEDREGIPGYGQPPAEVRTTEPEEAPEYEWETPPKKQ